MLCIVTRVVEISSSTGKFIVHNKFSLSKNNSILLLGIIERDSINSFEYIFDNLCACARFTLI